jgi:hypothetical protein
MSQGPLPQLWANTQMSAHGLWGPRLMAEMQNYNHVVGLKIVGEMLPQESNRVTLADDVDQYGLRIPRITYSWCDNDKRLIDHALNFMTQALAAVDARDLWTQDDDTCHLNGTIRFIAWSMPIVAAGIFQISGFVTDRFFRPWEARIRLSPYRRSPAGRPTGLRLWPAVAN